MKQFIAVCTALVVSLGGFLVGVNVEHRRTVKAEREFLAMEDAWFALFDQHTRLMEETLDWRIWQRVQYERDRLRRERIEHKADGLLELAAERRDPVEAPRPPVCQMSGCGCAGRD